MDLRKSATFRHAKERIAEEYWKESPETDTGFHPGAVLLEGVLVSAVDTLNREQCMCIRMMYFQDRSYRDIAALTGFTLNQVKSHIQNGKRNLKNYLLSRNGLSFL